MDFDNFSKTSKDRYSELEMSRTWPLLMRKVYTWMAMALAITGVVAYGVGTSEAMLMMLYNGMAPLLICIFAELGIVFYLSARIQKLSLATATTFFITAGTFAAMAIVGTTTKKDLTKMGGILFMALIGLIIAGLVNIFFRSTMFDLIVSGLGVLIFTGLTAWDAQKIKKMVMRAPDAGESAQKMALLGSLSLYLDFITLFLYLLRFFGNRN